MIRAVTQTVGREEGEESIMGAGTCLPGVLKLEGPSTLKYGSPA